MEKDIKYVVLFLKGYYAKRQSYYDWSFTTDLSKALFFKSFERAEKLRIKGVEFSKDPGIAAQERWKAYLPPEVGCNEKDYIGKILKVEIYYKLIEEE